MAAVTLQCTDSHMILFSRPIGQLDGSAGSRMQSCSFDTHVAMR